MAEASGEGYALSSAFISILICLRHTFSLGEKTGARLHGEQTVYTVAFSASYRTS